MKVFIDKYVVEEIDVPDEYVVGLIKDRLNDLDEDEIRKNVTEILAASARGDIDNGLYDMVISELEDAAYEFDRGIVGGDWYARTIDNDINDVDVQEDYEMDILADKIVDMVKEEFDD